MHSAVCFCRSACVTQLVAVSLQTLTLIMLYPCSSCCSFRPAKREIRRETAEGKCHLGHSVTLLYSVSSPDCNSLVRKICLRSVIRTMKICTAQDLFLVFSIVDISVLISIFDSVHTNFFSGILNYSSVRKMPSTAELAVSWSINCATKKHHALFCPGTVYNYCSVCSIITMFELAALAFLK